ncbi:hypothetical protein Hanom_Chr01g00060981 [Helianthus anomalus]
MFRLRVVSSLLPLFLWVLEFLWSGEIMGYEFEVLMGYEFEIDGIQNLNPLEAN